MSGVVVIGVGNELRGDDAAGLIAVRALAERVAGDVGLVECDGEATRLLEAWAGADAVLVVDAVRTGAASGTLHRWVVGTDDLPAGAAQASSHGAGIAEAVGLAAALERLPDLLVVHGIELVAVDDGAELSAPVAAAIDGLVDRVLVDVEAWAASVGRRHVPR